VLTPAQADELIGQHLQCLPIESLPLAQCAGAVLRENIYAERDAPPFDRVAMDGIALDSSAVGGGLRRLRIQATQAAGDPPLVLSSRTACIEVMTGAVIPTGCDSVIPVEQIAIHDGEAELTDGVGVEPWQNVHRRGTDTRQGALLVTSGVKLRAPEIAIAASAGMARIRVSSQPMLAVISTGNELIEPGEPILPHQVRRSNAYAIVTALRQHGFQRVADDHISDDLTELKSRLKFHLETHDVLVLSGGVSMGKFDLVPKALEDLGVRPIFHKVAQRPGKPLWFGVATSGAAVFGLPAGYRDIASDLLPSGMRGSGRLGPGLGHAAAYERFGRLYGAGRYGWLCGTATRTEHLPEGVRHPPAPLVIDPGRSSPH